MPAPASADKGGLRHSIIGLDLIRGLAALAVVLAHIRVSTLVEYAALPLSQQNGLVAAMLAFTRLGHEAVLIFFALSGFLVCGQIVRRLQQGRFDLRSYGVDRATRIFVPLVPACVFSAFAGLLLFDAQIDFRQVALNMAGLNGVLTETLRANVPLWTLAYEIWFYVVGGAVGYILSTRRPSWVALALLGCGVAVFCMLSARYLLFWVVGGLIVTQLQSPNRKGLAVAGVVLMLCGTVFHQLAIASSSFQNVVLLPAEVSEFLICAGVTLILPLVSDARTNMRLRRLRLPATSLSEISFSLYLFHYPTNALLDLVFPRSTAVGWESFGVFLARLVICLAVATVFYFLFERNTAALRRYIKGRMQATAPSAA